MKVAGRAPLALLAVSIAAWLSVFHPWHWYMGDLVVYRGGSSALLHGDDIYSVVSGRHQLHFTYPPFAAIAMVALAVIPLGAAKIILAAATLATLPACIRICVRQVHADGGGIATQYAVIALAAVLWFEPVRATVSFGQINCVLMAAVLFDVIAWSGSRRCGVLTGIAAAIKLTPLAFVAYFLLTRQRRAALTASITFAVCGGVGFIIDPGSSRAYWVNHYFLSAHRVGRVENASNQSVRGALARLLRSTHLPVWWLLIAGAAFALGLIAARYLYLAGFKLWSVATTAIAMLCASPISWSHHWVWCVVMLVAELDLAGRITHRRRAMYPLLASVPFATAMIFWPPHASHLELKDAWWQEILSASYLIAGTALVAVFVTFAASRRTARQGVGRLRSARGDT